MRFHFYYLFILFFSEILNIKQTFTEYWSDYFENNLYDCRKDENLNV